MFWEQGTRVISRDLLSGLSDLGIILGNYDLEIDTPELVVGRYVLFFMTLGLLV